MVTKSECFALNSILNEMIAPKHVGIIKSFDCILIRKSFIDDDSYIRVIINYCYGYEIDRVLPDYAYDEFCSYRNMLGIGFMDYELTYNCVYDLGDL